MAGSDESGEDMESGRVNRAEDHTRIWAQEKQGEPFNGDAIFIVEAARDIEDDDFTRATSRLHGIVGFGVFEGGGVVGISSEDPDEGIPQVSKVGVFGKGPTGVAGEGSPGVEGLGAANPFRVVDGVGVLGRGGRRPAAPNDQKLHGPGVVGLGGSGSRDVADADEVAGNVGVFGQGADGEGARRAGAGVVGRGGALDGAQFAPGVVGLTRTALDLGVMNPRDTGVFGQGGTGVTGQGSTGPGVRGLGGPAGATGEINPDRLQAGVVGQGGSELDAAGPRFIHGPGVVGLAGDLRDLPYAEAGETGVYGAGQIGVKGVGSEGRGGVFASERSAQIQLLPARRDRITEQESLIPTVASVALDSDQLGPSLPRAGNGGDLMAIKDDQGQCTLWFCVSGGGPTAVARWAQVLLGRPFKGRD